MEIMCTKVYAHSKLYRSVQVCLSSASPPPTSPLELTHLLAYSLVWSMGGHLSQANKLVFDQWWREVFATEPGLSLPPDRLIWDYYPNPEAPGFLLCSSEQYLTSSLATSDAGSLPPFVSTGKAGSMVHLIHRLVSRGCHVLLVGDPGSGKTTLLQQMFCESGIGCDLSSQHFYTSQVRVHVRTAY